MDLGLLDFEICKFQLYCAQMTGLISYLAGSPTNGYIAKQTLRLTCSFRRCWRFDVAASLFSGGLISLRSKFWESNDLDVFLKLLEAK